MTPVLQHLAFGNEGNLIRVANRGQTVSNHDDRLVL